MTDSHTEAIRTALATVESECPGWALSGNYNEKTGFYRLRAWVGYNGASIETSWCGEPKAAAVELIRKLAERVRK